MSDIENLAGDTRPIGVFDSGLGGLTVARAIATALPHESVYYFGDTKRCPYGTRTEDEVRSFALQAGRWLSKHDVKIMVIACNTATAAALRLAQQVLDVPVIGVIAPGARAAINSTRTRRVGVLATNLTIRSGAYTRAIQDLDAGVDVYGCPASSFVEVVEHELASGAHLQEQWLEKEDIFVSDNFQRFRPYARWSAPRLNRCATTASIPWYSAARIFRCSWGLFAMRWVPECAW